MTLIGRFGLTAFRTFVVIPIVVVLLGAVIWGGVVFRTYLAVDSAVADGTRVASVVGSAADADFSVLQEIKASASALGDQALQRVIVYEASDYDQAPSEQCKTTGLRCNIYNAADLTLPSDVFTSPGYKKDDAFPASSRRPSNTSEKFLGVYIEAIPGAGNVKLPAPKVISQFTVLKLDPTLLKP